MLPALEDRGLSDDVWSIKEMCALLPKLSSSASVEENKMIVATLNGTTVNISKDLWDEENCG
jgi:hypothetical protein